MDQIKKSSQGNQRPATAYHKTHDHSSPGTSDDEIIPKVQSFVTDDAWHQPQDTIHYISPATTARTVNEGDFDYTHFMPYPEVPMSSEVFSESTISCEDSKIQRTIAIVKPEAMVFKDVVLRAINEAGFDFIHQRTVHLTPEQVAEIYAQYYGCPSFPNMVVTVSVGPLLVLALAGLNAIEKWKNLIGPYKTLKDDWFFPGHVWRRFGLHVELVDALHASENASEATKENLYFFPNSILEPLMNDKNKITDYCDLYLKKTLLCALTELCRVKPIDPILFLAEWLLIHNPHQPRFPYKVAVAPT